MLYVFQSTAPKEKQRVLQQNWEKTRATHSQINKDYVKKALAAFERKRQIK